MSKFDPYEHLKISLNHDGSLTRYINLPIVDAAQIPGQPTLSKDVTLNADKKTWMRIYVPSTSTTTTTTSQSRLPIIFFFHPGGWIHMSVANRVMHEQSNRISAEVHAVVISVNFRLAPENRLPAQYEDAMDALIWVKNSADPWIKNHGDVSRCYLYGTSCGANIAYNTAIRMSEMRLQPLKIVGTILNQPFFGGKKRTNSEISLAADEYFPLPVHDLLWELALPLGTDRDHRYCNPFVDGPMKEKVKSLGRCLVIGFGGDPLIDRQQELVNMLVQQGVMVDAQFDEVGFHGIDLIDPRRSAVIREFIKEFVHSKNLT